MMFGSRNGVGFGGAIDYDRDLDGRNDKDARILAAEGVDVYYNSEGQLDADSRQLARSFRAQALMNPDVKKCVKHLWISFLPEDLLVMVNNEFMGRQHFITLEDAVEQLGQQRVNDITDRIMVEDTKRLLKEMTYDKTQFLIVRHSEKDNPHVHVILNMVDNEGNRLKDFQEKKRGIEICRQITIDMNYTWGDHKSVSEIISYNPKENARYGICKEIFTISKEYRTAEELKTEAARRNIVVKFSTSYTTGVITGISFAKDGFLFPAAKVDASLSAKKLFPFQVESPIPLSKLPEESQNIVKAGGVVAGFNNQLIQEAKAPELPQSVWESKVRDEYHIAIDQAIKTGSRTAYIQNIAGLALDTKCGLSWERAEAVSAYIKHIADDGTSQAVDIQRINEIIRIADGQARQNKSIFQRFIEFLENLLKESMDLKTYPIIVQMGRDVIVWPDLRDRFPGKVVGLAHDIRASVKQTYNAFREQARKRNEAYVLLAENETFEENYDQTQASSVNQDFREEFMRENESIGVKFGR